MYAVMATGGKQYKVREGDKIIIEKLLGDVGSKQVFEQVLFVGGKNSIKVGYPYLNGAKIEAEIIEHDRAKKIIVFKKKRRKGYRKKQGHRQCFTTIKINKISA